jgi:site-specific DNA-adenine methylase
MAGYFGSKTASGAFQAIVSQMPPHDTYIETHLGSGAVMRGKPPAARSIGLDLDPRPIDAFARMQKEGRAPSEVILFDQIDAVDFLTSLDFSKLGRVLIYADPPYVLSTRTSTKRYRCDYDDRDHQRLIGCLRTLPAAVILSGYPSALYAELLGDWRTLQFQVMTRGGPRTEQLWMNFAEDLAHWASCAGNNFTDRQRIKRKAARWATNYRRLSAGERLAVLAALLAEHGDRP